MSTTTTYIVPQDKITVVNNLNTVNVNLANVLARTHYAVSGTQSNPSGLFLFSIDLMNFKNNDKVYFIKNEIQAARRVVNGVAEPYV